MTLVPRLLPRRLAAGAVLGAVAVTSLTACTGGDDETAAENEKADTDDDGSASPEEVMAYAKKLLDETSGADISLSTADDPEGDSVLLSATGTITDAPAFDGVVSGRVSGILASDIGVISVDGAVWVDVPIQGWTDEYDPSKFCAPDPAMLLDPESGVSGVLTATTDLEAGESERGGPDNEEVLTAYSGSVPGDAIRNILPCSEGDEFEASYTVNADGYLRSADLTGEFYPGGSDITYTLELHKYDVTQDITAP